MLTQHLRQMERDGLIIRTDRSGEVPHVEYCLSKARGLPSIVCSTFWQHGVRNIGLKTRPI